MSNPRLDTDPAPRPWPAVAVITLLCVLGGFLLLFVGFGLLIDELPPEYMGTPQDRWIVAYLLINLVTGPVALVALTGMLRRGRHSSATGMIAMIGAAGLLGLPAAVVSLFSLVGRRPRRTAGWATAIFSAVMLIEAAIEACAPNEDTLQAFLYLIPIAAAIAALAWLRRARLQRRRDAFARTREDERHRIARDMHDSLSHRLSLISLHAGALEYRDDLDAQTRREAAGVIRTEAEAAVSDLREVLEILRDAETADPRTSVAELVEEARGRGENIELTFEDGVEPGELESLGNLTRHTLNRTVQETLTNARKHAPGAPVSVNLGRRDGALLLTVSNPVTHPEPREWRESKGFGLTGLSERASLTGGHLTVQRGEAMTVALEVPLR